MDNKTCVGCLTNIRDMFVVGSKQCEGQALKYHQNFIEALNYAIKSINDGERPHAEWVAVKDKLPEEKINPRLNDFEYVICSTVWGDIRPYKYGKPKGHDKPHFWLGGGIMDEYVIAWQELPEPYKKGGSK